MSPRNPFLLAADKLAAESSRHKTRRVNEFLATVEDKALHIERIGYRPRNERWNAEAMAERERGVLRQLETTASMPVYVVYDKATKSLVRV